MHQESFHRLPAPTDQIQAKSSQEFRELSDELDDVLKAIQLVKGLREVPLAHLQSTNPESTVYIAEECEGIR